MPAPARMLTHLRQAISLVRATPGRHGHVLDLRDCEEVLVAGDLHGHVGHFQVILQTAALAENPTRHLVLQELIHGKYRYPHGGDKSHQLVDLFAALKCQFPRQVHYIPGNHELAQWTGRPVLKADENLNSLFQEGVNQAYGPDFGPQVYATYLDLFQALPITIRCPNRVLICHSLPNGRVLQLFDPTRLEVERYDPTDLQPGGAVHSVLWGRDTEQKHVEAFLEVMKADLLVSGHIAFDKGYGVPNTRQLIVDCSESPAGFVLFPANQPLTHDELVSRVQII